MKIPSIQQSDYVIFVDESGDHSLEVINARWPLFVLSFCIFPIKSYVNEVTPAIRQLKFDLFGHDQVILHESDIRKKTGAFSQLSEKARESLFMSLTDIISNVDMTMIAIIIDKHKHKEKYNSPQHPYHLAMQFGLERVHHFLSLKGQDDCKAWVICESRGIKEDKELELEFRQVGRGSNRSRKPFLLNIYLLHVKNWGWRSKATISDQAGAQHARRLSAIISYTPRTPVIPILDVRGV